MGQSLDPNNRGKLLQYLVEEIIIHQIGDGDMVEV